MLIRIFSGNMDDRMITQVVNCLKKGGIIIYPTDTVYTLGCDLNHPEAYQKVCRLKGIKENKANFSMVCYDLSHISDFTQNVSTPVFRMMKKTLPGPYTYILNANNVVSKIYGYSKKTVGIRVPDNPIARAIVDELGSPIMSASIKNEDTVREYITDPDEIYEVYENLVDIVIDGGPGGIVPSSIIDCSTGVPVVVREGAGSLDLFR